jgi:hypothetical protein
MTKNNGNIYCDIKVKIFRFFNKFLHEPLFLELAIVLLFLNTVWRNTPEYYAV